MLRLFHCFSSFYLWLESFLFECYKVKLSSLKVATFSCRYFWSYSPIHVHRCGNIYIIFDQVPHVNVHRCQLFGHIHQFRSSWFGQVNNPHLNRYYAIIFIQCYYLVSNWWMMEGLLTKDNWLRFPPKPKEAKLNIMGGDLYWILPKRSWSNHSLYNIYLRSTI